MNELDNYLYKMYIKNKMYIKYMPVYDPYTDSWCIILTQRTHNLTQLAHNSTHNYEFRYRIR